jgi:hypothetical protein
MATQPARQPPAARRGPPPAPATAEDQPAGDGHAGREADLDAHITRLAADAPPLTSAQRDQLTLILRHNAASGATAQDRPARQRAAPADPGPEVLKGANRRRPHAPHRAVLPGSGRRSGLPVAVRPGPGPHSSWRPGRQDGHPRLPTGSRQRLGSRGPRGKLRVRAEDAKQSGPRGRSGPGRVARSGPGRVARSGPGRARDYRPGGPVG